MNLSRGDYETIKKKKKKEKARREVERGRRGGVGEVDRRRMLARRFSCL